MKDKNFISYFQSVITIGIMSKGTSARNAAKKAKGKLFDKNGVNHCFFDQSEFKLSSVEQWKPELSEVDLDNGISFKFDPNEETKSVIATRLQKNVKDITEEDYHRFVKEAIQKEIESK
jgi:hypothetical protein